MASANIFWYFYLDSFNKKIELKFGTQAAIHQGNAVEVLSLDILVSAFISFVMKLLISI